VNETIELSAEQLRGVQMTQLELLCEVRRICGKHGIRYNIIAGTLLGAVRHGGFIPWDDDADVALFRDEYEKFKSVCETELDHNKYYFQDHTVTEGYRWGYGKLRRRGTEFLRSGQEHMPYEQGIFIDVFPLDGVPDGKARRVLHNFHCFLIRKTLWAAVGGKTERNLLLRGIYRLLSEIPAPIVFRHYLKFMRRQNGKPSRWVRILTFPAPNKQHGYLRRWYAESAEYVFEGEKFTGIQNYDEYLTFKFGDWRTPPPAARRGGHPVIRLRLEDLK
jgi:lipopolysaccharide cholinephosphotransferase